MTKYRRISAKPLLIGAALCAMSGGLSGQRASAVPVVTYSQVDLTASSAMFSFGNGAATYTLSGTGDIFNPVAVQTAGTALVNSFGGFLGIPLSPTTNFINRGTVVFNTSMNYTAFPTTTTIPYSNGGNYLGLEFTLSDGVHVGYAEFTDNILRGYAFESTPGASITATNVPEPASMALLITGLFGVALQARRRVTNVKTREVQAA